MKFLSDPREREEIRAYLQRFHGVSPEDMLRYLGEMRDLMWNCMSPEGKRAFLEARGLPPADPAEEAD